MNNDKSLTIVEAAQSPQVVAVSDVSAAEIEYQCAHKEFKKLIDQAQIIGQTIMRAKEHLIKAWLAENYPEVQYRLVPHLEREDDHKLFFDVHFFTDSPREVAIKQEFKDYLAQLKC